MPWVTVKGHHILVGEDGEPTRPEDKKLLAGNKKSDTKKSWYPTTNDNSVTDAKTSKELDDKLAEKGLKLDSAYKNASNDEKVYMYNKEGKVFEGTYNKYSDGGREIVSIKEASKETAARLKGENTKTATIKNPGGRTRMADKALEQKPNRAEYSGKESKADKISSGKKYAIQKQQDTDAKLHYNKSYNNLSKSEQKMVDKNIKKYHPDWYK